VWKEVVEQGGDRPGSHQVSKADWINVHDLKNQDISRILKMELDEGESEAIALADELKADVVLLDEKDARRIAKQLGLRVLGTIGILVWGKRVGKINNLRQVLDILN
jgi:predicted nucleic acid-binding protein